MRIRIRTRPDLTEFRDFGVQHFRIGEVYDVSATLGSLLVIAGHAEPIIGVGGDMDGADSGQLRLKHPKG